MSTCVVCDAPLPKHCSKFCSKDCQKEALLSEVKLSDAGMVSKQDVEGTLEHDSSQQECHVEMEILEMAEQQNLNYRLRGFIGTTDPHSKHDPRWNKKWWDYWGNPAPLNFED
jgi:hypothetical protein